MNNSNLIKTNKIRQNKKTFDFKVVISSETTPIVLHSNTSLISFFILLNWLAKIEKKNMINFFQSFKTTQLNFIYSYQTKHISNCIYRKKKSKKNLKIY